jgi:hypothetical protein
LGTIGDGRGRLGTVGDGWRRLETVGDGWRRLETVGDGWRRLETIGDGWRRLKRDGDGGVTVGDGTVTVTVMDGDTKGQGSEESLYKIGSIDQELII